MSKASISRYESDTDVPREATLAKIAAFFGVTPAFLRYGVPDTTQPAGVGGLTIAPGPMLTPAQVARAREKSERNEAARVAAKSGRPKRRPGSGGQSA